MEKLVKYLISIALVTIVSLGFFPLMGACSEVKSVYPPTEEGYVPSIYVSWKLGLINPNDDGEGLKGFSSGEFTGGVLGARIRPHLAVELEGDYYETDLGSLVSRVRTSFANVIFLTTKGAFEPYLEGGLGFYFAEQDFLISPSFVETSSGAGFGVHLGGGLNFRLTPNITLGAEIRWMYGDVDFGGTIGSRNMGGFAYTFLFGTVL
jgi:opacity protein-like surface antigen